MASTMYGTTVACRMCYRDQYGTPAPREVTCLAKKSEARRWANGYHLVSRLCQWKPRGSKSDGSLLGHGGCDARCHSCGSHNSCECETEECDAAEEGGASPYRDFKQHSRGNPQFSDGQVPSKKKSAYANQGLAEACKFVYNDAKFVNERAQSDILLLSRGITRLNKRACQDAAVLGLGFLKLDARARKDTQKIDNTVKERAARLNHFARAFKERAQSDLKKAADKHWSDGALEADLRRADLVVKRRAMEDALMALKFVQDIHDMMVNRLYEQLPKDGSSSRTNSTGFISLEKNGKTLDLFPGEVSADQIYAIEEAYQSMASAFSEADGIDYTDPEELELLIATLIDLDAMDGKRSVSLIAECSSSPDVNTRKALANALATAPSMWTLGNAGMGALQRLAQDPNYAVARAASSAIDELKKQWELEEGDSLRFVMNQNLASEDADGDNSAADDDT
ncbi:senescence-associated protein OSA15, chloroplastic-like [Miscanthus floridulus]|uniref:senescence-associated protein OSA15, chloroplastic-like n=1 Tax=Miscanthus floridulus TaxID=154761 RepID=UPI0034587E49